MTRAIRKPVSVRPQRSAKPLSSSESVSRISLAEMDELGPIRRDKTLSEHAYERIRQAVMVGVLKPNQKVTVRAMAAALDISITPAREALTRLISEGALQAIGVKTVIVPPLTLPVLDEITAIRLSLEGLAAEKAAPQFSRAEVDQLEEIQAQLIHAMDRQNFTEVLEHNEAFHFGVYRRSDMPRLVGIIESLWIRIGPSLNLLYPTFAVERHGVSNHKSVLKALRQQDGSAARAAFEKDIRDGYQRLKQAVVAAEQAAIQSSAANSRQR